MHGRIALLEEHVDTKAMRVTDYKTGKRPDNLQRVGQGEHLQPILYALAAERLYENPVLAGRLYFATAREEYATVEIKLDEDAREDITLALGIIDGMIEKGFLPAAPRKSACDWCDYRAVCGPLEETRILKKDGAPLGPLVH